MNDIRKNERKNWVFSYNMIFSLDISCHAKIIYMFLCRCADSDAKSFPSKSTIAENCSISVSSVKAALKELMEIGLIEKEDQYRNDGSQTSNLYTIYHEPSCTQKVDGNNDGSNIDHQEVLPNISTTHKEVLSVRYRLTE